MMQLMTDLQMGCQLLYNIMLDFSCACQTYSRHVWYTIAFNEFREFCIHVRLFAYSEPLAIFTSVLVGPQEVSYSVIVQ